MRICRLSVQASILFVILLPFVTNICLAQSQVQYPHYVIIGAFSIQQNAEKFTAQAIKQNFKAEYKMNPNRNLFYVYVLSTTEYRKALLEARRLRRESKYTEAWIYNGPLGEDAVVSQQEQQQSIDLNPDTGKKLHMADRENINQDSLQMASVDSAGVEGDSDSTMTAERNNENAVSESGNNEKNFIFEIYRGMNNAIIEGEVSVIDADQAKKIATYQGNIPVKIPKPGNESGDMLLVCDVFGYRKVQKNINWSNIQTGDGVEIDSSGHVVIPFELVRLQKGDIVVMYNVYFFIDAAVMRPESKYEVNSLLEMLNENPAYQIKIHGHTNGNAPGKVITMGESKNFFSLTDTKDGFGSAKKLSEERAKVIREYLIASGIAPERMKIKAWGGKRPLYDKHGPRAQENVRVEIEILEDK